MSAAGLVPIMELAEQTGLSWLIGKHVDLPSTRVKSGAVNPSELTTIIGGMICGADSIDDVDVLRAGGTPRVFDEVYAPSTLGIFLREFTFGHANELAAVARTRRRSRPAPRCCPASSSGRSWTSTRCCARSMGTLSRVPRSGTPRSPAARCCGWACPADHRPVDRAGRAGDCRGAAAQRQGGSGRAAAWQVKQAIGTARECGAIRTILLRGDSAFGTKRVMTTCVEEGVEFSLSVARNKRISTAIGGIDQDSYTSVHYPGAVEDPTPAS